MLYLVIFISKLELLQKSIFQQHRGRHLSGLFIHLFSQELELIWVKTAWLYLYWFKSYDRLQVANWDESTQFEKSKFCAL